MNRRGVLTVTIAALSILGMALATVAAPNALERNKCYDACMRDAQLNTRASVRTLAESASPISISARLFVGLAVLARLAIKSVRAGRRPRGILK
jgi:hypothetical protein